VFWHAIEAGNTIGWVRVEYSLADLRETKEILWWHNLTIGGLVPLFCIAAILLYLRRPLRQLRSATEFAQRLANSRGEKLEVAGGSAEVEALVRSLNDASLALATSQQRTRDETDKLNASEARIRAIFRTMRDGVVHINAQGTILSINNAIEELFGYEESELIGRNVSLLVPEPHRSAHDSYLARYQTTRQAHVIGLARELEAQRKNGNIFPIELKVNEMTDDEGSTYIGVIRDITAQQASQRGFEVALEAAQAAAETKSRFLANMSHEIRTPINAVLGFSDLCLRLDLPARGRDYVTKIHGATQSLLGVINDILDFSKIEAGQMELEVIPFSLGEVLHRIANLFSVKAREKGVELVIGALPDVPDRLQGDPLRLGQVLTNLVGNALKFTARGEIALTVETASVSTESISLRFVVRDTGKGMTPEQLTQLFKPFVQADSSTTREYGGTGLGLAISKQLVESMGGMIHADSEAGVGSRFSFTVTLRTVTEMTSPRARSPLDGKRILVVDDNAVMRKLLVRFVEVFGCWAEATASGMEALALLQQANAHFDLILMDWRLPDLDGLATAQRIRAMGKTMPIVLVTGDAPEEARAEAGEHDIQAFLAKPVSSSTLHDTLVNVLDGHAVLPTLPVAKTETPDLRGARILLVDDNDFNRQVGSELIGLTGAEIDTVNDGEQAVAAVESGDYDLVLMDLQMPVMDGYTAARIIRERHPDLTILALTAHAMSEERARVLAAGMDDILTKPILPTVLYAMLSGRLATVPRRAVAAEPILEAAVPVVATVTAVPPAPTWADSEGFDFEMALSRFNNDPKVLERFLRLFRERNAGTVADVGAALAVPDWKAAQRLVHTLKGSAGTIGLTHLQLAAARLEKTLVAAAADSSVRCDDDFAALEAAWAHAREALAGRLDTPEQLSGAA
jgi:two-component system sensor histidine kinase/response regulator